MAIGISQVLASVPLRENTIAEFRVSEGSHHWGRYSTKQTYPMLKMIRTESFGWNTLYEKTKHEKWHDIPKTTLQNRNAPKVRWCYMKIKTAGEGRALHALRLAPPNFIIVSSPGTHAPLQQESFEKETTVWNRNENNVINNCFISYIHEVIGHNTWGQSAFRPLFSRVWRQRQKNQVEDMRKS